MNYLYLFWGKVVRGKGRGKPMGFPTINIRLHSKIPEGVYVSETKIKNTVYKSVSFVGAAKTFGEKDVFGETFVFDFKMDIYGEWVSVSLLKKLRENKKFSSEQELVKQMERDKAAAVKYFNI